LVAVAEEPRYRGQRDARKDDAGHGDAGKTGLKKFPKEPKGLETGRWTTGQRWDVKVEGVG